MKYYIGRENRNISHIVAYCRFVREFTEIASGNRTMCSELKVPTKSTEVSV